MLKLKFLLFVLLLSCILFMNVRSQEEFYSDYPEFYENDEELSDSIRGGGGRGGGGRGGGGRGGSGGRGGGRSSGGRSSAGRSSPGRSSPSRSSPSRSAPSRSSPARSSPARSAPRANHRAPARSAPVRSAPRVNHRAPVRSAPRVNHRAPVRATPVRHAPRVNYRAPVRQAPRINHRPAPRINHRPAPPARRAPVRNQPVRNGGRGGGRGQPIRPAKPNVVAPPAKPAVAPPARPRTLDDRSIWNKYRTRLAYEVARRFCNGQTECDYVRKTEFQLITTSMNAVWNQDKNQLNKDVVGFAPAWSISYKPTSTSQDGVFSELYKKYLLQSKNIGQFKAFMGQQPERNGVFYNWEETQGTLNSFIQDAQSRPSGNVGFKFNINLSTDENLKNSWATLGGGYNGDKGFIRTFTKENAPLADLENHFDGLSDSQFIFGRDRTVYHHVYQTKTVVIKTNKFDFQMDAVSLGHIRVQPGKSWFDKEEFMNNVQGRAAANMVGPNGLMPLLPASIIVAYKPKVEIVVSKSVYEDIQNSIKNTEVLGWLVGGARFRSPQIKALNDDGSVEYFTKEEMASGKFKADEILFEKIEPPRANRPYYTEGPMNAENSDLEKYFDETSKFGQLSDFNTERTSADSEGQWLFRRRRTRHVTVTHVVEKKVEEGNYKITWVSHSDVPQILGVVSERL